MNSTIMYIHDGIDMFSHLQKSKVVFKCYAKYKAWVIIEFLVVWKIITSQKIFVLKIFV